MLFLLIACAAAVYLWHHAPALLLLLGGIGVLWYVVIPLCIIIFCAVVMLGLGLLYGLDWMANTLPDWWIFRTCHSDGLLTRISFQGWVAISMATFVVFTLLAHTLLPR